MKHSRGLKVNLFPLRSSSRSERAFQGYQLGSAAGRKVVRGWGCLGHQGGLAGGHGGSAWLSESHPSHLAAACNGAWGDNGVTLGYHYRNRHPYAAPRQLPGKGHTHIHGYRNIEGGPNLPGGGSRTAKETQGTGQSVVPVGSQCCCWGPGPVVHDAIQMPSRHNSPLEPFASCPSCCTAADEPNTGGSSAEPSWLGGCEMRPRLCGSCPVLMLLMGQVELIKCVWRRLWRSSPFKGFYFKGRQMGACPSLKCLSVPCQGSPSQLTPGLGHVLPSHGWR